jgi:NADPH-dependent F420 reductase
MVSAAKQTIAIVGGSGALGFGLALRWGQAGHDIIIGSRSAETAHAAAAEAATILGKSAAVAVRGMTNPEATNAATIVVLAVPFSQQKEALISIMPSLGGKILIDTTVPLAPPKVGTVQLPPAGSSAMTVKAQVGDSVRIVSAFQNFAAAKLRSLAPLDCDILICGDDKDARQVVVDLASDAGLRGFHAGPLANAIAAEALTSILITINRQFKCEAGLKLVGVNT